MLTFKPESHEYFYKKDKFISVTTALKEVGLIDLSKVPADILERALLFGTAIHKTTELYDKDNLNEQTLDPGLVPYLEAWKKFRLESGVKFVHIEDPIYSERYRFAGTPDRIGYIKGILTVLDLKSGADINPVFALQLAGYEIAYNENVKQVKDKVRQRLIIRLCEDGSYKLPPKNFFRPSDDTAFLSIINFINWKKTRGV